MVVIKYDKARFHIVCRGGSGSHKYGFEIAIDDNIGIEGNGYRDYEAADAAGRQVAKKFGLVLDDMTDMLNKGAK